MIIHLKLKRAKNQIIRAKTIKGHLLMGLKVIPGMLRKTIEAKATATVVIAIIAIATRIQITSLMLL